MTEMDDIELLHEFAENNSDAAFAALVERHVNFVYSFALRSTSNSHSAEEITQAIFIILARKAKSFSCKTILTGWLHQTTRLTAANYLRTEIRRAQREQEAFMQSTLSETNLETWTQIAPLLDDAIAKLGERDRNAILLRYFENKSAREMAAALRVDEPAAQKRVTRAVEKLRKFFAKRGVTLTAAAIVGEVSANSVQAAPMGLAATVTAAAAKGAAVSASTLTLIKGALKIMTWTKMKTVVLFGASILLVAASTVATVEKINSDDSWRSLFHLLGQSAVNANLDKTPPQVTILPTIHPDWGFTAIPGSNGRMIGINASVTNLIQAAYEQMPPRMLFSEPAPAGKYDFIANLPKDSIEALQQKIKEQFGLVAHKEIANTDLWVLKVNDSEKLKTIVSKSTHSSRESGGGKWKMEYAKVSNLADALEGLFLKAPVLDQTRLSGRYDFTLQWDIHDKSKRVSMITDELNQVGLELVPTNMPIEMLVVEKVK